MLSCFERTCPSHHPLRNQRCFAHNPLRGSTTQRKLTAPGSQKKFKDNTYKRLVRPVPAHTTPPHFDLLRTACASTSTHSKGFCSIWVCVISSLKKSVVSGENYTFFSAESYKNAQCFFLCPYLELEPKLELGLIQTHMAQKPLL